MTWQKCTPVQTGVVTPQEKQGETSLNKAGLDRVERTKIRKKNKKQLIETLLDKRRS